MRPLTITVEEIDKLSELKITPIERVTIPGINIPDDVLVHKKYFGNADDIQLVFRSLLNSVTLSNIDNVVKSLQNVIRKNILMGKCLFEYLSQELLKSILISERNIRNVILIINNIYNFSLAISDGDIVTNIVMCNVFLSICRSKIVEMIAEETIRENSLLDTGDVDELNEYNQKREQTINLISAICLFYGQRNNVSITGEKTSNIVKLQGINVGNVLIAIIERCAKCIIKLEKVEDDYDEIIYLQRMINLYAEYSCVFFDRTDFKDDSTELLTENGNVLLKDVHSLFIKKISPHIVEPFLLNKYEKILNKQIN